MTMTPSVVLFAAAGLGLALVAAQVLALRRHLAGPRRGTADPAGVSVLKPLCGVDDDLERNLLLFADLDHPRYEVLLGVRSRGDPAWKVAQAVAARRPDRFRVVLQRGEPGLNPKVNQLVTLAAAARHDLLVVSDSNVRVPADYLREIAAHLEDAGVGLVTHPIAGVGERGLGALFDNLQLAGGVTPGMVAAKRLLGRDVVVGKSMALRRRDLEALGGFESVKDVLAEDYVLGVRVAAELGKRVALASRPVENVNRDRTLADFVSRYARWGVMQRKIAGPVAYGAQGLLNPVLLAGLGALLAPGPRALALLAAVSAAKALLDGAAARALRPAGFAWPKLVLVPAKDLLFALAWARGFAQNGVRWRGHRLRVLAGSRLEAPAGVRSEGALAVGS